jgi:hypothetical protein
MIFSLEKTTFFLGSSLYPSSEITDGIIIEIEGDLTDSTLSTTENAFSAASRQIASLAVAMRIGMKPEFNTSTSVFSIFSFLAKFKASEHTIYSIICRQEFISDICLENKYFFVEIINYNGY